VTWVARKPFQSSDRRLSTKLVPNFADRGCHVVSVTDPYGRILDFVDRSRYFFIQVAPQLYSRGWVDHVSDPLLLRKSGSAGNRKRTSGSLARNSDHQTTEAVTALLISRQYGDEQCEDWWETIWTYAIIVQPKIITIMVGLKKTTKFLTQGSRFPGSDTNRGLHNKSPALLLRQFFPC
jgi:hypothetical protein